MKANRLVQILLLFKSSQKSGKNLISLVPCYRLTRRVIISRSYIGDPFWIYLTNDVSRNVDRFFSYFQISSKMTNCSIDNYEMADSEVSAQMWDCDMDSKVC